ncbi:hypothetical protein FACS1894172_11700 [Spirochaetia bacterium]|nr:hypothetical protein FACS1894172_11700 [Spirochaetia bacterium]
MEISQNKASLEDMDIQNISNIEDEINKKVPQIIRRAGEIAASFFAKHPEKKQKLMILL